MPTLLDLFCGRGGWSKPALALGWRCIGIDIEDHGYPGELHRRRLPISIDAVRRYRPDLVVASPPCEEFARWHLPFRNFPATRNAERLELAIQTLGWSISLIGQTGSPVIAECSKFAARHVPGARFVGSYALWGDVPAINPIPRAKKERSTGHQPARRAEIPLELAEWIITTAVRS
jgi:hypothetical protein